MIRIDDVRVRIAAQVPGIRKLGNAADFARIVEKNRMPQVTPAAFVMFGGLLGGRADIAAGLFRQDFSEAITVVLMDRVSGDPLGNKALDDLSPLVRATIEAVCGWAPADAVGVFQLRDAELVGVKDSTLVFQIDFVLNDQLRITS